MAALPTSSPTLAPTIEEARASAVLFHDASRARIALVGDDRFTWLNGAASCDVVALEKKRGARATYGCVLTVKGKLLGDAYVVAGDEALGVWIPATSREAIVDQWEKYIVMEDVELALDESRALLSLQGGRAVAIAEAAGLASRGAPLDDLGLGGGLLFDVPRDEASAIVERLVSAGARVVDDVAMNALRVEAGRATFGVDVDGKNYVQEGGLEKRAVSFSKGCYVGQEVVCMLQMRGHVHRKLARLAFANGGAGVAVGAEVQADGATVGAVTSVVSHDGERASALAMLKYGVIAPGARVKVGELEAEIVGEAS